MSRLLAGCVILFGFLIFAPAAAPAYEPAPDIKLGATGVSPPTPSVGDTIWGWADLHNHQFANYGFGGHLLTGHPWGEPSWALLDPWRDHGVIGCWDWVGNLLRKELGGSNNTCHDVSGYPNFSGWPAWNTFTHQTMYYKWVQRAYLGGQRLMVMAAVNNSVLCKITDAKDLLREFDCNDMSNADTQLAMAKHLERWIDVNDDGAFNDSGWYRIAYTPDQARRIIADGDMAVILAIEVDTLFNCGKNVPCDDAYIQTQLDKYHDIGVRHVFPIHLYDNRFGGAAIYDEVFNAANYLATGEFYEAEECGGGYDFKLFFTTLAKALIELLTVGNVDLDNLYTLITSTCNTRGLEPGGETLIAELMDRGMMIDVDHMSKKMRSAVIAQATERGYPLISGHNLPNGILKSGHKAESNLSDNDIAAITELGGMVAINIAAQSTAKVKSFTYTDGNNQTQTPVPYNCSKSSEGWAQSYLYALQQVRQSAGSDLVSVGLGTDFNGFVMTPQGRLVSAGANCDRQLMVAYPFPLHGLTGSMSRQISGKRTFNINFDGVAHAGMLPDFIRELELLGLGAELDPLFRSAEKYIQAWETADAASVPNFNQPPPLVVATISSTPSINGWYLGAVGVGLDLEAADDNVDIVYRLSGATVSAETTDTTLPVNLAIGNEGQTVISYHSLNRLTDARSVSDSTVINIDTGSPEVTLEVPPFDAGQWYNEPVAISIAGSDDASGIAALQYTVDQGTPNTVAADQTQVIFDSDGVYKLWAWALDNAGHASNTLTIDVPLDQTPPTLTCPADITAKMGEDGTQPSVNWSGPIANDALSGALSPALTSNPALGPGSAFPLGTTTVVYSVNDNAGNSSTCSFTVTVIDATPPVLNLPPDLTVEATEPDGAAVLYGASAHDNVDGAVPVTCTPDSATVFGLGDTTVSCSATDNAGNLGEGTFLVSVRDTTPPLLECPPAPLELVYRQPDGNDLIDAFLVSATATDIVDQQVLLVHAVEGLATDPGRHQVTFTATDFSGNQSSCSTHIQVSYEFGGFTAPLSLNKPIKLGRVIAIKFILRDALGNLVDDASATLSDLTLLTDDPSQEVAIEPDAPGSVDRDNLFRYDAEAGQYVYNLSTKPLFAGTWLLTIELNDGNSYTAELMLK